MADWPQIHISLDVGTSREIVGRGWRESDGIRRQNSVEKQGKWGIKVHVPTEPVDSDQRHCENIHQRERDEGQGRDAGKNTVQQRGTPR